MKTSMHVSRCCSTGQWAAVLIVLLMLPLCTHGGTASVTANCRSVILKEWTGTVSGQTVYVSITTYDGSSGRPLGLSTVYPYSFANSEELRPRSGTPGVYEADYAAYSGGLAAYGRFTITLPTTDTDGNGLPDVTQKNMPGNATFSGTGNCDWHVKGSSYQGPTQISNGWLTGAAGTASGTFGYTGIEPGGITVVYPGGVFNLNIAEGSAAYTRPEQSTQGSMTLNLTLNDGETTRSATATTTFTVVNENRVTLPQFSLSGSGFSLTVQAMTLDRTGKKYRGDMSLVDGNPESSWADYTRWVVEIEDNNDADGDGVPDLSDLTAPAIPPTVQLTTPLNGATYLAPATVTLNADAEDADGTVAKVEFYNGTTKLGEDTSAAYSYTCNNLGVGNYTLIAKATDNNGNVGTSSPVQISVNQDSKKRVIYSTAFESTEGYAPNYTLRGQNGWVQYGDGDNAVLTNLLAGQGASAFIGFSATAGSSGVRLRRPINYTPVPALPLVKFSVLMNIVDSTNSKYDEFIWRLYNSQGTRLLSLDFYNPNLHIYYLLEQGNDWQNTQKTFTPDTSHQLLLTLDVPANRWSATLDGQTLASQQPITTASSTIDIGDIEAVWWISETSAPGNNYMVFDNYQIWAESRAVSHRFRSLGRPSGGKITLQLEGEPGVSYTLQTSSKPSWNDSNWLTVQTNTADAQGLAEFTEDFLIGTPEKFYRARRN